jgi:predicted phage terminase large subunit-like protein
VTIEGYGKGASIRGLANNDKRPDIIICNDLQDVEDARSDSVQEKDWEWFLSDVKFLGQYTRIFMIGNNLGERCIIERVFNNADSTGFKTLRVAIADPLLEVSNWPSKFSPEFINKERKAYDQLGKLSIWLRERMCVAVSDATRVFCQEDYQYYSHGLAEKICQDAVEVFATLDPASSKGLTSCFRAIIVCARMKDGHWYILEVPYGRWDSVGLIEEMFKVVQKWGVRRFGVEKGHFHQILEPFIYKEMTRRNTRFQIIPLEHGKIGSKLERIKMLQPRFKCHNIWFPNEAYWLDELKAELAGVTNDEIKSLYIDLVDALAMCEQMDTSRVLGVIQKENQRPMAKAIR